MIAWNTSSPIDTEKSRDQQASSLLARLHQHQEGVAAMTSGAFTLAAWMLDQFPTLSIGLYLLGYIIGGYQKAIEGAGALLNERKIDVNLLMLLAAIGAASIGYWLEGGILIFIFALSGAMESYTMARSSRDIASLIDLKPETALLWENGVEKRVPVDSLIPGAIVVVKPGASIPVDGIIREGSSAVNQASITGESLPVEKAVQDEVFAGTINGQGALLVEVTRTSEATLFAKIVQLVHDAQNEMPPSHRFLERFEGIYAKTILILTLLLMLIPPLLLGWDWQQALYRSMVFLVVASPCALVASIMPAVLSAISTSARKGLLFKGGVHLENLAGVKVVAFDKTGTLTKGTPIVTHLLPLQGYSEHELLQIAASIEQRSEHPLAQAIVGKAEEYGLTLEQPKQFQALSGWGVTADLAGETWKVGKAEWLDHSSMSESAVKRAAEREAQGETLVYLQNSAGLAGIIAIRDTLRPDAPAVIRALQQLGIKVVMLTGDRRTAAEALARAAGVEEVYAQLLPEQKSDMIEQLKQRYGSVAMVGDGVNDAPALARSTVGIAMGGTGSEVSLDVADLVLMNDDLTRLPAAISLARKAKRIIKQNICFSLTVILLLVYANFVGEVTLPLGVVGHEGSTILVILNGLRLLRSQQPIATR
ncbi:cadmium-translocating P-type ATPase [Brevibacillus humidisoli]|uniref:heavy metal translocating P-type ATPase n=1 Tax=Brevibacillus humidisoli TaxID=2895522 RepID=UPI001E36CE18|nr:heavy metal translocating P-type ATPase [Brevibacillus humidisoli]UFJ40837.1 cadmium-translocating P-type ATPase [Brevibacillus humidisoli]